MTRPHAPALRSLRIWGLLGVLACPFVALTSSAASTASPPPVRSLVGFRTIPLSFTVEVGPAAGRLRCRIVGDLRIPNGVTRGRPAPGAILATNGFGGSKNDAADNGGPGAYGARFAEQGYVTLAYSSLGFGGSGCNITVSDPLYDGQAGSQLISFLGGAPGLATTGDGKPFDIPGLVRQDPVAHDGKPHRFDPRVGMIGGSSGGEQQFAIAGQDPRLDAIIPIYTWNDLDHALTPNNADPLPGRLSTATPGIWKAVWQSIFFGLGVAGPVTNPADPTRTTTCGSFQPWICQATAEQAAQGFPSAVSRAHFRELSVASYIKQIRIPVLLAQGQRDSLFTLNEAAATYASMRAQGTPVRMLWQSWGHSVTTPVPGELSTGTLVAGSADLRDSVEGRVFSDWFAHWLRDEPTDLGPALRYFRPEAYLAPADPSNRVAALRAATAAYASAPSYPIGPSRTLFLSGSASLVPSRGAVQAGSTTFLATGSSAPTNTGEAVAGDGIPQEDTPGTFASWTGSPLSAAVEIAGVPQLTITLDAPHIAALQQVAPEAHLQLFAKVYDVAPDGSRTLVRNLASAVRVPDVTKSVTIDLPGVVYRFKAQHAVQLVLASSDSAYKGAGISGPVTVRNSALGDNVLRLPVTGMERQLSGAPGAPMSSGRDTFAAATQVPATGGAVSLSWLGATAVPGAVGLSRRRSR